MAAGVAAAEWLHQPAPIWVGIAWACVAGAGVALWPLAGWRRRLLAALLLALAASLTLSQQRLTIIETRWPPEREHRVTAASQRLAGDLHSALQRAERLAQAAILSAPGSRAEAFHTLDGLVPRSGPEMSVVVFDQQGLAWAWAGRHRLPPQSQGDTTAARASRYYVVLEARRHSADGRSAVAGVLIWAHPAVPDRGRSLTELFRASSGVDLAVYRPGTAPDSADVFDYEEPTAAGSRLLFSVQPVPPEQGVAKELAFHRGSRAITGLVLLIFAVALSVAATPLERFLLLPLLLWLAVRAPVGAATRSEERRVGKECYQPCRSRWSPYH